jgi:gliding motility-associated-like protein
MIQFVKLLLLSTCILITKTTVLGQCGSPLSTPTVTNNGQSGIMFDVQAIGTNSINMTQLAADYDNGTYSISIYWKAGTHVGFTTNAAAWTLLGTANGWVATGGVNVNIPITFSRLLCPGQINAFYITVAANNPPNCNYSNGTAVGAVAVQNADLRINQGTGKAANFGANFTPRVPNVRISYTCQSSCCTPPTMTSTPETCSGNCNGTATATVGTGGVGPYTYQWNAAAGNQITQTATGLCAGTYSVTVTDATGCVATGTVTVTSGSTTANTTITSVANQCITAAPITLVSATSGGTWSGTGITNAATGTFNPTTAGAGTHTITYTIAGACGGSSTTTVTVLPQADATITPIGPFCQTAPAVTLSAATAGGTWSGTGITNATTGVFNPTVASSGTHVITYTAVGICGNTGNTTIVVNPSSNAAIAPAGPFCVSSLATTLVGANSGGVWSGTGITNTSTGNFDPAIAGAGTHTITYSIAGTCGDSQTTTITVIQDANATITPTGPFCELNPVINLTAVDPGGVWSGTGITSSSIGSFDPSITTPGTFTITYTIGGLCGDIETTAITVNESYDAAIPPVGPFCASVAPLTLSAADPGGIWSGTGITNAATGIFDPSTTGPGTHVITYSIPGTCGDTETTTILVNALDDATITPVGTQCLGAPVVPMNAVTGGGIWSGPGIINPSTGEFNSSVAGTGIHTISYVTSGPCPDNATTTIEVLSALTVAAAGSTTFCDGQSATVSASGNGGDGNLTYTWTDPSGNVVGTGTSVVLSPSTTTTYTVTLTDGCTTPAATGQVILTVNPIPSANFTASITEGCVPLNVVFVNTSPNPSTSYSWNFGNGTSSSAVYADSVNYVNGGNFTVSLTASANGCSFTQSYPNLIAAYDNPVASFSTFPQQADILDAEFEFFNGSSNADSYSWTFGDMNGSTAANPVHSYPSEAGEYTVCLIANTINGCSDTACLDVSVIESLIYYIPNAFTPDGNEFNQTFQPIFTTGFDPYNFNLTIYNRWGEVVFESNDPTIGWDGTSKNGAYVQSGTYTWRIKFKLRNVDEHIIETGHVNMFR